MRNRGFVSGTIAAVSRKGSVQLPAEMQKLDCSGMTITVRHH